MNPRNRYYVAPFLEIYFRQQTFILYKCKPLRFNTGFFVASTSDRWKTKKASMK